MTPLDRAIQAAGSLAALAAGIREQGTEVSNSAPGMWKQRNRVPAEYCPAIEALTTARGARVTCEELRPDVAWHVVRGEAGAVSPPRPLTLPPVTPAPAPSASPGAPVTRDCRTGEAEGHAQERAHPDKSQLKWPECGERRKAPPEVPGSGAFTRRKNPDLRSPEPAL